MVSSWLILKMTSFVSFRRRKQSCNNILNHFLYHKRTRQLEYTLYYNQVPHQYSIQFIVFPCNILVVILYFTILIPTLSINRLPHCFTFFYVQIKYYCNTWRKKMHYKDYYSILEIMIITQFQRYEWLLKFIHQLNKSFS